MEIYHFCHEHPLTLIEGEGEIGEENPEIRCYGCWKLCTTGPIHGCTKCGFYLHRSCAELPEEFQNPLHPHPLTLYLDTDSLSWICYSCSTNLDKGFFYQCKVCKFNLHVDCALFIPTITKEEGHKELSHVTHWHPLSLVVKDFIDHVRCLVCWKHCLGPCYGCNPCGRVLFHQQCAEFHFPQQIQSCIHPHPLALHTQLTHSRCGGCCYDLDSIMSYFCEQCDDFRLDVDCALSTNIVSVSTEEQIKHFSHTHPEVDCFPPEIQDFLHIRHPLTLLVRPASFSGNSTHVQIPCNLCAHDCNGTGITYQCHQCNFNLHVKCTGSGLVPTVKYEVHPEHLLYLVEKINPKIKCNACNKCCDSWVLHCGECDFNLHVPCGPLPYTIKHECDIHPLTLMESPVEEDHSDDEFYCDVCEKQRDPRLPFYYSKDCGLVAEIACVISEVVLWLKGEYGDVDLRTPAGRIAGKVISKSLVVKEMGKEETEQEIEVHSETETGLEEVKVKSVFTFDDILRSFTKAENTELNDILKTRKIDIISIRKKLFSFFSGELDFRPEYSETFLKNEREVVNARYYMTKTISAGQKLFDEQDSLDIPLLSDVAYGEFMKRLEYGPQHAITFWKNEEEVVSVRDYMVTRNLAPVLEGLCATYGDVSTVEYKKLTSRLKTVLLVILCGTIDSMCNTKVVDISEDLIHNWWNYLKHLQSMGFKIQFAFDHLKRIVHAYLGLRLREQEDKTLAQFDKDIIMYSEAIEEFTKIMDGLKLKRQQIASEQSTRKSSLIEECLRESSKLKWRNAGEGLLQLKKVG